MKRFHTPFICLNESSNTQGLPMLTFIGDIKGRMGDVIMGSRTPRDIHFNVFIIGNRTLRDGHVNIFIIINTRNVNSLPTEHIPVKETLSMIVSSKQTHLFSQQFMVTQACGLIHVLKHICCHAKLLTASRAADAFWESKGGLLSRHHDSRWVGGMKQELGRS